MEYIDVDPELLFALASVYTENFDPTGVRPLPLRLYFCLILDIAPTPAARQDFGIASEQHYGALQFAVKHEGVTPQQLDAACGRGAAIRALVGAENPYYGIEFETAWDRLRSLDGPADEAAPTSGQRGDEE